MKLIDLYSFKYISLRSYNVCKDTNLNDLSKIKNFYEKSKTFLNLKNCGTKSNKELIDLCLNFKSDEPIVNIENPNMKLIDLYSFKYISLRSYNVCKDTNLNDLSKIKNFYEKSKTFLNLKNCGTKSNKELIDLCLNIKSFQPIVNVENFIVKKDLIEVFFEFSIEQKSLLNRFIEIKKNNLSVRSINALKFHFDDNVKFLNFCNEFQNSNTNKLKKIRNLGIKSQNELESFFESIINYILKISELKSENEMYDLQNRLFIENAFCIEFIPEDLIKSRSIFKIVDFFIKENVLLDKKENVIFEKMIKIYRNQKALSLANVSSQLSKSFERLRQVRLSIFDKLKINLIFIKNIKDNMFDVYNHKRFSEYMIIDDELVSEINFENKTNFSNEFIAFLLYLYNSDQFEFIGNIVDVLFVKIYNKNKLHNWNNFFLVKKELNDLFDFKSFSDDMSSRLSDRIEETYFFNIYSYLNNFIKGESVIICPSIFKIVEEIINKEFDLVIDLNDNIVFNRNTPKQVFEYAIEALEKLGAPSNIEDIYKFIEKDFPEITKSKEALRGSLQRIPEIIYFGRSSTFGLKKWETEMEGIMGGTIRSIVIKFLDLESSPIHISKISNHVLQYRPDSNEKSIYTNLKMDESNSFIFFKDSYVGLVRKKYDNRYELLSKEDRNEKKSWDKRYTELSEFLILNNRLPFSSGYHENEIKLYRWYKIQVEKTKNGGIEEEKSSLINEIIKNFEKGESTRRTSINISGRRTVGSNSKYTYEHLIEFIIINKRIPDSRDPTESSLYQFYYRNKKNLENIDAPSAQEIKLVELIEKFGSSKHPKFTIDELIKFIKTNKRMPNSRKTNERGLYHFAYKQRKLFEEGDLDQLEVNKFIEITKIIQNQKYEN